VHLLAEEEVGGDPQRDPPGPSRQRAVDHQRVAFTDKGAPPDRASTGDLRLRVGGEEGVQADAAG